MSTCFPGKESTARPKRCCQLYFFSEKGVHELGWLPILESMQFNILNLLLLYCIVLLCYVIFYLLYYIILYILLYYIILCYIILCYVILSDMLPLKSLRGFWRTKGAGHDF